MSFYHPPATTTDSGGVIVDSLDTIEDPSAPQISPACHIVPGNEDSGTVDCAIATDFSTVYTLELAAHAAAAIAAQEAQDGTTPDYLAYELYAEADGPGYATYGCRRPDHPEDMDTVNGCAATDFESVGSRLEISGGDWYPTPAADPSVVGNADGTGIQQDADYGLHFGLTPTVAAYLLNPSPLRTSPDTYGNDFWEVMWPAGTIPGDITIASHTLGVHGTTMNVYLRVHAFKDTDVDVPPPSSSGLLCVL